MKATINWFFDAHVNKTVRIHVGMNDFRIILKRHKWVKHFAPRIQPSTSATLPLTLHLGDGGHDD